MSNRPGIDPNDWHASKHGCPDGLLKDRAWSAARKSYGTSHDMPAQVVERAKAFHAWLAPFYAITESSASFWRAVEALDRAVRDHASDEREQTTLAILATADLWVAALVDWESVP